MALNLFYIFCFLTLIMVVTSYADLSPEQYWKSELPNIEIPQSIGDMLYSVHTRRNVEPIYVGVKPLRETTGGIRNYGREMDSETPIMKDDPNLARRFFLEKDLQKGNTMTLQFTKSTNPATFFPRTVANTIPFSSKNLPQILLWFSIKPESTEAEVMKNQIEECEEPGIQGEEKYCATSLEDMVDYSTSKLGKDVKVVSTKFDANKLVSKTQKYKVQGAIKVSGGESKFQVCHKKNYAYGVFFCHNYKSTKAFVVTLKGEDGTQVKAVAVCHMDTSNWNPKHLTFKVLGVKPGTVPICHFLSQDNILWYNN